jgi:hypothetical protein
MDFTLNLPMRWACVVGVSVLLWVIPITINAPSLIVLFCLIAAIGGFVYSAQVAGIWQETERQESKQKIQSEEIHNFALALEEQAIKGELMNQYGLSSVVQKGEPERLELSPDSKEVSNLNGDCEQPSETLQAYYTNLNLTAGELSELLPKLRQTMTKQQVIEQLWGVKKGGSTAYKRASTEFDQFIA